MNILRNEVILIRVVYVLIYMLINVYILLIFYLENNSLDTVDEFIN